MVTKQKIKKCKAGIKIVDCSYKKDIGIWGSEFAANAKEHIAMNIHLSEQYKKLTDLSFIRLNGDETLTPTADVLREIYFATKTPRNNNKLKLAIKNWMDNTGTGHFFQTKTGKMAGVAISLITFVSYLYLLGVISNPVKIIVTLLKTYLKIQ